MTPTPLPAFNHLLAVRPLDALLRLDDAERTRLAAGLAARPPSQAAWQMLWELFGAWPDGAAKTASLADADRALAGWDDRLRTVPSSDRRLIDGGRLTEAAKLVRSVEIHRRDAQGSAELAALATSDASRNLAFLAIVRSEISGRAWQALTASAHLARLRHLHVGRTSLGRDDVVRLFASQALPGLRCVKLVDVGLTPQTLAAVPFPRGLPGLRKLDLSGNALSDDGTMVLARAAWLQGIERLTIQDNRIRAAALQALLDAPCCRGMAQIDASRNLVAETDKAALAASAVRNRIQWVL